MDPKNTTLQSPGFIQSSHPQYTTQINQTHPNSYSNSPCTSGVHNQWQVTSAHHRGSHLEFGSTTKLPSTPVIQRQMNVQPFTESHLAPQKPSDLHSFLESKANEPPVIWINKKEGILEINNWGLLEAQWKKAQVHKGISPPRDLHNDLCYSEDITGLTGQQYGLKFKTKLVTKMPSNTTSRPQHTPYHRPEQSKEPQLSTYSSIRNFCATRPTQNVISSPAQLYCCSFLEKQAEIGASVIWADKNQGVIKVINPYQLSSQWNSLQQQHGLLNGETLQDALKKESEKGDIEYLGSTPANENIFQLKYKNYSASIMPLENNQLTAALPTMEPVTSHANFPQGSTSGTVTTQAAALDDVFDILKAQGELPKSPTEDRQIPLSIQSANTVRPIRPAYNAPKSCEGFLSFIFSNADAQQSFSKWHNRAKGELIIDIEQLTHEWLSINPSSFRDIVKFDFVARYFATQNYWAYDASRNIFCLNLQHPMILRMFSIPTMEEPWHSSTPQMPSLSDRDRQPSIPGSANNIQSAGVSSTTGRFEPQKNPMLEWIMEDIGGLRKFTQWHEILKNKLKLHLHTLETFWRTNLQSFSLENIETNTATNSITQLVNEGLCQYDYETGVLTLNESHPQTKLVINQQQ